jgi:hypothetical protein
LSLKTKPKSKENEYSQMIEKKYLQNKNNIKIKQTATISQEIQKKNAEFDQY